MTFEDGVYKTTLTDMNNKYIALAPTSSLSGDSWNAAIRPEYNTSDGAKYTVNFMTYSGIGATGGNSTWYVDGDGINIDISYRPTDNYWEVKPYRTATIGSAEYITYSNGEKCKVSGAEAIYVITQDNGNGTVHGKEMDANTVWPANEGMILKGNNKDVITISAVASDETPSTIGNNYLVGSGNSTADITAGTGIYIFAMKSNGLGFYKAEDGTLAAHKAYLDLSRTSFNAREFLGFDFDEGDATGISAAKTEIGQNDQVVYDLQGRKINGQCSKGLYIVNGKKVIIK